MGQSAYTAAWRDYSRRRNWFAVALLSGPGLVLAFSALLRHFMWPLPGSPILWIMIPWFSALAVAGFGFHHFRCPRCGNLFFVKAPFRDSLARQCLHCGLPKWANDC